jgi:hypothetical protein
MTKMAGSGSAHGSGSISQRVGSVDPDPDPYQNAMNPQHWDEVLHMISVVRFEGMLGECDYQLFWYTSLACLPGQPQAWGICAAR